jgi:hypothetical protein
MPERHDLSDLPPIPEMPADAHPDARWVWMGEMQDDGFGGWMLEEPFDYEAASEEEKTDAHESLFRAHFGYRCPCCGEMGWDGVNKNLPVEEL